MERDALNIVIGQRVREAREYHKLSREKVAERSSISTQFLSDIETGRKSMTTYTLRNISLTLGISADYLLFGKQENAMSEPLWHLLNDLNQEQINLAEELLLLLLRGFQMNNK